MLWTVSITCLFVLAVCYAAAKRFNVHVGFSKRSFGSAMGTIEGTLYSDGKPAPRGTQVVSCFLVGDVDEGFTLELKVAKTNESGLFRFRKIPAGEASLGRRYPSVNAPSGRFRPHDVERRVEVHAGECTRVDLGIGQAHVSGQLLAPRGLYKPVVWKCLPPVWLVRRGPGASTGASEPLEFSGNWRKGFCADDTWRQDCLRWYYVPVDETGRFEVAGIYPGHYVLVVQTTEDVYADQHILTEPNGIGFRAVEVAYQADSDAAMIETGDSLLPRRAFEPTRLGVLEGSLYIDGKAAPAGTPVVCSVTIGFQDEISEDRRFERYSCVFFERYTKTDSDGKFRFDDLPAGEAEVGRGHPAPGDDGEHFLGNTVYVAIEPEGTAQVTIDGSPG